MSGILITLQEIDSLKEINWPGALVICVLIVAVAYVLGRLLKALGG